MRMHCIGYSFSIILLAFFCRFRSRFPSTFGKSNFGRQFSPLQSPAPSPSTSSLFRGFSSPSSPNPFSSLSQPQSPLQGQARVDNRQPSFPTNNNGFGSAQLSPSRFAFDQIFRGGFASVPTSPPAPIPTFASNPTQAPQPTQLISVAPRTPDPFSQSLDRRILATRTPTAAPTQASFGPQSNTFGPSSGGVSFPFGNQNRGSSNPLLNSRTGGTQGFTSPSSGRGGESQRIRDIRAEANAFIRTDVSYPVFSLTV